MARRLYIGRLAHDARTEEVSRLFEPFGEIVDTRVMSGFGFVEFNNPKDAEDALEKTNGQDFLGQPLVVEFAKESRPRPPRENRDRDRDFDRYDRNPRARRPPGIRLLVTGLTHETSWQDLKDFGREVGSVSFADVDRDNVGTGVLEYLSQDDADRAVRELTDRTIRGKPVRVAYDDARGPDNYRRDERRRDYDRDDRYGRDDRRSSRRDRSRSPYSRRDRDRDYDEKRRSPPRNRDYDYDRRRSSPKREERKRDDY